MDNPMVGGQDIPYKGYVIAVHDFFYNSLYRVDADDGTGQYDRIVYEGTSVEDCKAWIDAQEGKE